MEQRRVNPWTWQDALSFSQAIEVKGAERVLYCAGQTSVDGDGAPLHEGDMKAQMHQALDNLERVLADAGLSLSNVVRMNFFTTDVDAFLAAYEEPAGRLARAGCQPASTLLQISRLASSRLLVEVEATAVA